MNSARVFPAIIPESITDILPFILIPVMATGTKCRVFRPGEDAAANPYLKTFCSPSLPMQTDLRFYRSRQSTVRVYKSRFRFPNLTQDTFQAEVQGLHQQVEF